MVILYWWRTRPPVMSGNHTNSTMLSLAMLTADWVFAPFCVMIFVGILANVSLIITICRRHTLRRVPTYVALMDLALVDVAHLLFLIGAGTIYAYDMLKSSTLCQILIFGMYSTTGASSYHLVIFSALRYVILVKPFFALKYVTVKNTLCCCLMCWLVFPCFAGLAFLSTNLREIETSDGKMFYTCVSAEEWKYLDIAMFTIEFYNPLTLISGFHVAKCVHLKRRSIETANTLTTKQQVSSGIVVTIIILYAFCYFPVSLHVMTTLVLKIPVTSDMFSLGYIFLVLIPLNSTLNPFVYFFFTKCVRKRDRRETGTSMQTNSPQRANASQLPSP